MTGNPRMIATCAPTAVRVHDGHLGSLVHGHAEPKPIILVDEVAHTAITMPGGEAALGADSHVAARGRASGAAR